MLCNKGHPSIDKSNKIRIISTSGVAYALHNDSFQQGNNSANTAAANSDQPIVQIECSSTQFMALPSDRAKLTFQITTVTAYFSTSINT
jgi:hypothetical protein